ncbi:DUF5610 domain-containing protein [Pseudoduganella namucuonensis]|uniref:DUF5610 domain-containing protein n=1 Tax=Pseudoduganella namucuonensis TaxID=1035707 RepID=A0A1I7I9E4_9BURK|nr:DUF5610 domain-containing protein [Pseudoduganella namucuonensis]SFU69537.1 hypothetical protein SAMN05216552_1007205 [Pseudoduganella namucuonensis]
MAGPASLGSPKTAQGAQPERVAGKDAAAPPPRVQARQQLNASIIQSSISVAIGAGDEPMALLYKSAMTSINEALAPEFGPDAIQNAAGQDNSPEGTAGRIVSMSTAFYEAYKQQHAGEDEATVLRQFMDTIQVGVDQGFKEARDILQGLKVLDGGIAANIDKTEELVRQGLAEFAGSLQGPEKNAETQRA